jgi:NNP family nitrate/nitrite transporter-like MFS transporter
MTTNPKSATFWQIGHRGTLLSAFLYTEVSFLVWIMLGPLAVHIAKEFTLNAAQIGMLVAIPILAGTLLRLPVGILVDHFGPKMVGTVVQLLVITALVGLSISPITSVAEIYLLGFLLGLAGASFSVAMPLVSGWYPPEHQGKALGITALGGGGTLLTALFAPFLADIYGWQAVFSFALMPVAIVLVIYHTIAKESGNRPAPQPIANYFYILRYRDTLWFCFFYAITFGGFVSLASSLVVYFYDNFQIAPTQAGSLTALCIFGGALFRPLGGWLADYIGGIRTLNIAFALISIILMILGLVPQLNLVFAFLALLLTMTVLGLGNGAVFQLLPLRFFRQMGIVTGLVGTAGGLSGFLLAASFGYLREETGQYHLGFLLYAGLSLIALMGLWTVKSRWRTTWGAPHVTSARV